MSKIALLFPGQGSQFAGMGKSLAEAFPAAREVFREADEALGFPLSRLCFEGPEEELRLTENTQPAILAASIAAFRVYEADGGGFDFVAGHSLGEYSALVAAGALSFGDAVRLVRQRGRLMQEAAPPGTGAMAALLRLPEKLLDGVLAEAAQGQVVSAANFNSPDQIVIAGHSDAVDRAMAGARAAGARRAVKLPVSAPFHCALMKPAQDAMRPALEATAFHDPRVPLVNNWQAREIRSAGEARQGLIEQIPNPVCWTQTIGRLAELGATKFIEVGPGGVLSGLMKSMAPGSITMKLGEAEDVEKLGAATA